MEERREEKTGGGKRAGNLGPKADLQGLTWQGWPGHRLRSSKPARRPQANGSSDHERLTCGSHKQGNLKASQDNLKARQDNLKAT